DLAAQLEAVPLRAEDHVAANVEQVQPQLLPPLGIEVLPFRHRLAGPEHPRLTLRTGPIAVRRPPPARLIARRRARVARSVGVDERDLRAEAAKVERGEAAPQSRADDDDLRRRARRPHGVEPLR